MENPKVLELVMSEENVGELSLIAHTSELFVVQSDFFVKPDCLERFIDVIKQHTLNSVTKETGCISYEATVEEQNPQIVNVYEKYVSKDAYLEHRGTAHYAWFREQVSSMLYLRDDDVVISRRKFKLISGHYRLP
ncbi:putative quinol monooxygenase [Paraburkholderia youngii]|uniref:putative quinol monooxygenase n=1 Tax=Paraburkholderia youngii TaxID=2782701 RepID=UPI003D252A95